QSDPSGLRKIVREDLIPLFDLEFTARLILGRAGRSATPEQVSAFADALSTQLIRRYTEGLLQYESRDQLDVLPLRGENSEKMTRVRTRVKLSDGQFVPVDYAFRKTDAGWKAFDVIIEGISYVTTYRNQISPRVAADGIDEVTRALNEGELQLDDA
ncbi:MAG: ABC transporter substrate-binding protein, partial [Xanthomonadales bacterium]|nr:ABC transporter substrate-binding protein [Xanthomonadales bacterium]